MGFKKRTTTHAAIKAGIYGPPGSGKTFTALLIAEGLAALTKKRIAFLDTEVGSVFYEKPSPDREYHPEAFDFDTLETRSLSEINSEVSRPGFANTYGVVIFDSATHLWEAAQAGYKGPRTRAGTIPINQWGALKKPYKDLIQWCLNCPLHVLFLARQAQEWADDDTSGEKTATGYKMKTEGETAYEFHLILRMEAVKPKIGKKVLKNALAEPTAFVEKDRSGALQGRLIVYPNFESVAAPILKLLDPTAAAAHIPSDYDSAAQDAEAQAAADLERITKAHQLCKQFTLEFSYVSAKEADEREAALAEVAAKVKAARDTKIFSARQLGILREAYEQAKAGTDVTLYQSEGGDAQ